jgi:hypothetical protein
MGQCFISKHDMCQIKQLLQNQRTSGGSTEVEIWNVKFLDKNYGSEKSCCLVVLLWQDGWYNS